MGGDELGTADRLPGRYRCITAGGKRPRRLEVTVVVIERNDLDRDRT
jgi:hypothetical protein